MGTVANQIQRQSDIEHYIHWPPEYAKAALGNLRAEMHSKMINGEIDRWPTAEIIELAEPALPRWKSTPVTVAEFIKELRWDIFCAINHV